MPRYLLRLLVPCPGSRHPIQRGVRNHSAGPPQACSKPRRNGCVTTGVTITGSVKIWKEILFSIILVHYPAEMVHGERGQETPKSVVIVIPMREDIESFSMSIANKRSGNWQQVPVDIVSVLLYSLAMLTSYASAQASCV